MIRQLALVCTLALLAHGWSLRNGFVYDDHRFIVENAALADLSVRDALLDPATHTADRDRDVYRPLRVLSHAFDHARWGLDPFGFHLHSILLHALCVGVAWLALQRLVGSERPSAPLLGAGLLAVHPIGVEVVGWVSSRGDQYALAFGLAGLALGARSKRPLLGAVGAGLALFLAVLGKESAAVLPLVAWLLGRATGRGSRAAQIAMVVGVAAALGLRQWALEGLTPVQTQPHGGSLITQAGWALHGLATTARHLVWPSGLSVEYPQAPRAGGGLFWGSSVAGLALAFSPFVLDRRGARVASALAAWTLLAYLPSSSLIVTLRELVNDRAAYPLLAPLGALCACALGPSVQRAGIALLLACTVLVPASISRSAAFHDDLSLWEDVTSTHPGSVRAELAFAALAMDEAAAHRHLALAVQRSRPGSKLQGIALSRLGEHLLNRSDRADAAIPVLEMALDNLRLTAEREVPSRDLEVTIANLARAFEAAGRIEEADALLGQATSTPGASVALFVQRVLLLQLRAERSPTGDTISAVEEAIRAAEVAAPGHPLVTQLRTWRAGRAPVSPAATPVPTRGTDAR